MATRATTIPLILLLATGLLCAAAYSREEKHSLRKCVQQCKEDRPLYQRAECVADCRKEQRRREREGRREHDDDSYDDLRDREGEREHEHEGEKGQSESSHPYVFSPRSFRRLVGSEQGSIKALRPFQETSKLLRGIRDYRIAFLEASPRSFVAPGYTDADSIAYVVQGEGAVTLFDKGEKRSFRVREGDVFVALAGSFMHAANTDGRRKLVIVQILHTISVPGEIQLFSGASVVSGLSKRIQRAAFKSSDEKLEKLFGRQQGKKQGFIVRASEEQISELRRRASEGGHGPHWPLPPFGESRSPYNLLEQKPKVANRHGRIYEADARSFHDLADHDVRVSLVNITAGSMTAPFYNTRSVKIALVLDGEGEIEIVCPHLPREERRHDEGRREHGKGRQSEDKGEDEQKEEEHEQGRFETVQARVSRGAAFVVPVGHPVVEVASRGSNLKIVCFEVPAEKNERVYLAGANSVLRKLDRPAKELAFSASEKEVDEVLNAQPKEGFFPGPEDSGHSGEDDDHRGRGGVAVEELLRMAVGGL